MRTELSASFLCWSFCISGEFPAILQCYLSKISIFSGHPFPTWVNNVSCCHLFGHPLCHKLYVSVYSNTGTTMEIAYLLDLHMLSTGCLLLPWFCWLSALHSPQETLVCCSLAFLMISFLILTLSFEGLCQNFLENYQVTSTYFPFQAHLPGLQRVLGCMTLFFQS